MKGAVARMTAEQDGRAWLAWHIEALARTKKLPKLEKMMGPKKPTRGMSPEQMEEVVRGWLGGRRRGR